MGVDPSEHRTASGEVGNDNIVILPNPRSDMEDPPDFLLAHLEGVPAVLESIKAGMMQCRVYNREKFHAKAYITHGKFDVIGSQALVGSSNFTRAGLTENVELNLKIESSAEVAQLQAWYERHWEQAVEVTDDVVRVIARHAQPFSPFDVYARALQALFADHEVT
ncbi:MAG: phospholipase D-like domain-containing protein, partial [Acidimicrobiales bacterium]